MEDSTETVEIVVKCEVVEVSDESDREDKPKIKAKPYQCEECAKMFKRKTELTRHMRTHTGEKLPKIFNCTECPKKYQSNGLLKRHMRCHLPEHGERNHTCVQCGLTYTQAGHLKEHELKHHGEAGKNFKCSECNSAFFRNTDLSRHMRIHTGDKKFSCTQCGRSFVQKCNLDMHIRTHTGDRRFQCVQCDKKYITNSRLVQHYKRHEKKRLKDKIKKEDYVLIQMAPGEEDDSLSSSAEGSVHES